MVRVPLGVIASSAWLALCSSLPIRDRRLGSRTEKGLVCHQIPPFELRRSSRVTQKEMGAFVDPSGRSLGLSLLYQEIDVAHQRRGVKPSRAYRARMT